MNDRNLRADELALIFSPTKGLRLEMPTDEMPIGIDGTMLAACYVRLNQGGAWTEELKRWVMREIPGMVLQ
jgi:hypothetical protein